MNRLFSFVSLFCLLAASASAQEARGTIVGKVLDATGASIPNATVVVGNKSMGTKLSVPANEIGYFQALYLIPGQYQITAEVRGFKKYVRDGIEVRVNDRIELDIVLEVGAPDQSITITEEAPLLNTTSGSIGSVVDSRRVAELPIAHGNPYQLIGLATGVAFTRDARLDRPFEPTHIVGYSMDGTRANRSDITLDGTVATATANAGEVIASYVPPADIVQEFKVQTATFDASFGQTEGGVTNISIKSGTNAFHGTAYWMKLAPSLFANDFFANANRVPRPDFTYDRWGGTVGGPIRLPKLYDGRNKTFFMWGYEGIKEARPRNNGTPTVPTAKMKSGDFSDLLAINSSYQIYNPFTRRSVAGGRFQQDPYPGNIIPTSQINPVSRRILEFFPNPLQPGNRDGTNNYQRPELTESIDYSTHTIRVDHVVSSKQRLFVRTNWYDRDSNYNNYFNNVATGEWFQFVSRGAVLDDVYMISPTLVLNVRYGYNRFIRVTRGNPNALGFDLTSLGFPASYNNSISPDIRRFPRIEIAGYQGTAVGGEYRPNDTHNLNVVLQKAAGSHFLKMGAEFRAYREQAIFTGNDQTGRFNFDSTWTRGPLDNAPAAPGQLGQSVASFLLGLPALTNSLLVRGANYAEQSTSWGFFLHDDWKVNSRLAVNLGLRWEFDTPLDERFNRTVRGFDFAAGQPFEAQARANYARNPTPEVPLAQFQPKGGLTFAGVNGQPRGVFDTPKLNFMPRVGFSYKLTNKTVLRGGYGIFFGFLGQRRGDVIQTGFSRNTPMIATNDNGLTFSSTLSNPFPNGILEPLGASQGSLTFVGQGVSFFFPKPLMPYMQRWQLGFQHELPGGFVAEAGYVGNRGTHIELGQNLNVTPQQYLSRSLVRDNPAINYLSANLPNPFLNLLPAGAVGGLTATNVGRERLLRPLPHFDSVSTTRFDGYSWYHSLQVNLEKRFSRGYTFSANYTLSKFMQASETLLSDDLRPTEVISDLDRPHRLTLSGIYELPFGRGKAFLAQSNAITSRIVGGWQLNGIYTFQSGSPINWGNLAFSGDVNNIRLNSGQRTLGGWFNAAAGFERAAPLQLANNVRYFPLRFGFIRAHHINNYDLSVIKNTRVAEGKDVQFRAEFLNAFNRALFPAPNTNPAVIQFATIQANTQANYARRIQLMLKFIF